MKRVIVGLAVLLLSSCTAIGGRRTIVASAYPFAFAAERIAGPGWTVVDLTASGADTHDIELSLEQRAAIEEADVVIYPGPVGLQPQVEQAVAERDGPVISIDGPRSAAGEPDPHYWLSPQWFLTRVANHIQRSLGEIDGSDRNGYLDRFRGLARDLEALDRRYDRGLSGCRFRTIIVPHEAFHYLSNSYGLSQFGLAGADPEGEPTSDRVRHALDLIRDGKSGAVFYEPSEESERIAEGVADDGGVPALPLSTLEARPPEGDYLSVMQENLASLQQGLGCR